MDETLAELREIKKALQAIASSLEQRSEKLSELEENQLCILQQINEESIYSLGLAKDIVNVMNAIVVEEDA